MTILLSIIVPIYNTEKFIVNCVESCYSDQLNTDMFEIILVNDGSSDSSLLYANNLRMKYSNIFVISQENRGLSAARNVGINNSHGKYVFFLDSDDWVDKGSIQFLLKRLSMESSDVILFRTADFVNNELRLRKNFEGVDLKKGIDVIINNIDICATCCLWKKDFLDSNNLRFVEGIFHEDIEFSPRAYFYAKSINTINKLVYCIRSNPNSITRTSNPKRSYDLCGVIVDNLYDFSQKVDIKYRPYYYRLIAICINIALLNMSNCEASCRDEFVQKIVKNKKAIRGMFKSISYKHKIESLVLSIFPRLTSHVYFFLQKIQKKCNHHN